MSSVNDLAALQATLDAIPHDVIRKPNIPIKHYLQEAENLAHWCQHDQPLLTGAGLDWCLVENLPVRIGALREAESLWFKGRFSREQAQQEWDTRAPHAYALRDQLLRAMRFAFRRDTALLKRVSEIAEGRGHADMIQDLNDIAALGRDHPAPLQAIRQDLAEVEQASDLADQLGALLAQVNGERADISAPMLLRNRAFTHLKAAVDEINACGQYVFWNNAERRDGYISHYHRATRKPKIRKNAALSSMS